MVSRIIIENATINEELSKLNDTFSPFSSSTSRKIERTSIRTFYSNVDLSQKYRSEGESSLISTPHHYGDSRDDYYSHYEDLNERVRSPSLPPIDRSGGGGGDGKKRHPPIPSADEDTSGYLSDSANQCESPDVWRNTERGRPRLRLPNEHRKSHENSKTLDKNQQRQRPIQKQYKSEPQPIQFKNKKHENVRSSYRGRRSLDDETDIEPETDVSVPNGYGISSSNSSDISHDFSVSPYGNSMYRKSRDERAKWGDRGVTIGHFYDPVSKDSEKPEPVWLERGLHDTRDSGDESVTSYSFIRGQNAPIDPNTLAERATKRLKALEFQNAIKEQLAEREIQRRRELENRRNDERRQEELLKQQLEHESKLAEQEQRRQREKIEKENRKRQILVQALERAAEEAKLGKERKRRERGIVTPCTDSDQIDEEKIQSESAIDECSSHQYQQTIDKKTITEESEKKRVDDGSDEYSEKNDEEKILIGSPIRLRKKNVPPKPKRTVKSTTEGLTNTDRIKDDLDGVALLIQPLQPFVPIAFKDTSEYPNLQFAVMLAHQFPQFTPMNLNVMNMDNYQAAPSTAPAKIINNFEFQRKSPPTPEDQSETSKCNICGKNQRPEMIGDDKQHVDITKEKEQAKDLFVLPHDGTFTKETKDIDNLSHTTKETTDVSTQTEVAVCDLCGCKHTVDSEFDDLTVQPSEASKFLDTLEKDEDCNEIEKETTTTTTTTTTTIIRSKTKDQKLAARPKWGVNRPLNQYVKASERDPFYLRNKRNKFKKRSQTESDVMNITDNSSRSTSPSLASPPPSSKSKPVPGQKFSRNVCTEILPIKTDVNGKIFLNFREASVVMTEDEIKQNLRQRYCRMERIMNRRKTSNEILDDLNGKDKRKEREMFSHKNVLSGRVEMPALKKSESFKVLSKRGSADMDIESY